MLNDALAVQGGESLTFNERLADKPKLCCFLAYVLIQKQQKTQIEIHSPKVSECNDNNCRAKKISDCWHNGFCLQIYRFQQLRALKIYHKFLYHSTFAYFLHHCCTTLFHHHFTYSLRRHLAYSLYHDKSNTYHTSFIVLLFSIEKHDLPMFFHIKFICGNTKAILMEKECVFHYNISKHHFMTST